MRSRSVKVIALALGVWVVASLGLVAVSTGTWGIRAIVASARGAPLRPAGAGGVAWTAPLTTPTGTASPTVEVTATASVTATEDATPTRTPRPTRTPTPAPAYLPIGVKDPRCVPQQAYVDVMFVLDGSAYMEKWRRGKPAWDTALEIIGWTLDRMDFVPDASNNQDQAGLLVYRHQRAPLPEETLPLTANKGEMQRFLGGLSLGNPRDASRMDIGMNTAAGMVLDGARHRPGNRPVLIIVSEMQTKNVPNSAPGCDPEADDYCSMLKYASDIKAAGIAIVIFATGWDNRSPELEPMASSPSLSLELPTREDIDRVFRELAPGTPCDPAMFWPYGSPRNATQSAPVRPPPPVQCPPVPPCTVGPPRTPTDCPIGQICTPTPPCPTCEP